MENSWVEIENIMKHSNKKISVFDGDYEKGKKECNELHIPLSSVLGSVVLHSNGIIIDNWIRIFGQDGASNYGVPHYNRKNNYSNKIQGMFLVGSDVLGGLYAININRFSDKHNMIWYFAPDTLEWECIEMMYNEFLAWCLQGNTDEFYSTMRWQGWEDDAKNTTINTAILIYPFLWAEECDLKKASKKIINLDEMIEMNRQLLGD